MSLSAAATEEVAITFATRDGTAISKDKLVNYTAISNAQPMIPKVQINGFLSISTSADQRSEQNESLYVDFTNISGAEPGKNSVQITILSDDVITGGGSKKAAVQRLTGVSGEPGKPMNVQRSRDRLTGIRMALGSSYSQPVSDRCEKEEPNISQYFGHNANVHHENLATFPAWLGKTDSLANENQLFTAQTEQPIWLLGWQNL